MVSPLPSLQVRKGSAVNEFLGWLIEKMAEVYRYLVVNDVKSRDVTLVKLEPVQVPGL